MKYKKALLNSGAKLYYVRNKISKTSVVEIGFPSGARCDKIPGLAHFTEHMFFTGTSKLTKEEVTKKYFDFINANAFTSVKDIYFTGNVFTKEFEDYLSTVATLINESTFTQSAVDKEVGVIQQEIARNNDKFQRKSHEFNTYNLTHQDVYKNEILGSKESVASVKSKDVKNYVKKYFIAENMEVYVSSPLSFSTVKRLVEKNLAKKIPSNKKFKKLPLYLGYIIDDSFYEIKTVDIDKCYFFLNFKADRTVSDFVFKRRMNLVLDMMNDVSEGVMKEIRLNKSLVYGGRFNSSSTDKDYCITFSTECDKANINELMRTIADYLNNLVQNGFTEAQLKKAKREYDYDEAVKEPRVSRKLNKLYDFKYYGKIIDSKWLKKLTKEATLEDCNAVFKEVFASPKVSMSIYGNATKKDILSKDKFNKLFK